MNKLNPLHAIDEAKTPVDMRAAIERHARYSPITRQVLTLADINGMTPEDRYTMLAYYALQSLVATQRALHNHLSTVLPRFIITDSGGIIPEAGQG